jgi:hypothetical protein
MNRWRIEETIRFVKQSYNLEDIRLLACGRLQKMVALVLAVTYLTTVYLGPKTKLRVLSRDVLKAARQLELSSNYCFFSLSTASLISLWSELISNDFSQALSASALFPSSK